ncbi:hypothetical protein KC349_g170 [Hortaea werneckii]|nr:hypothetical protein KC349_g170 [Hortaea werneckii]
MAALLARGPDCITSISSRGCGISRRSSSRRRAESTESAAKPCWTSPVIKVCGDRFKRTRPKRYNLPSLVYDQRTHHGHRVVPHHEHGGRYYQH